MPKPETAGDENTVERRPAPVTTEGELAELREIAKIWRGILQSSQDAIVVIRMDGSIETTNPIAAKLFGLGEQEAPGRNYYELLGAETRNERREYIERIFAAGKAARWEDQWNNTFFLNVAFPIMEGNRCLISSRDITGQKQAEESAQNKRARLSTLIEMLPDMIWLKDTEGRYVNCNHKFEKFLGVTEAAVKGKTESAFLPEAQAELFRRDAARALRENRTVISREWITFASDGHREFVEFVNTPFFDSHDVLKGVMGFARDVTAFKQAEESLIRQSSLYKTQLDLSLDAILVVDDKGNIIDHNQKFVDMWGLPQISPRSTPDRQLVASVVDKVQDSEGFVERIERLYANVQERGFDEIILRNGRILERYTTSIIDEKHVYHGRVWYFRDITERKQAEAKTALMEAQLRQAQKLEALGTLAGGIAHDFNNILTAIISYAELARLDTPDNLPLQENLEQVLIAGNRAASLVRQILSFSRQKQQERRTFQLSPLVKEVVKMMRSTLPTTLQIETALQPDLPEITGDPTQIHQVLMNLCTNAAHAMQGCPGRLQVKLDALTFNDQSERPHVELKAEQYLRLTVADNGRGIEAETMKRMFEPFFTTKPPGEGTGLGLSVVHGIIKDHGGAITVKSKPGEGATFAVYLPVSPEEPRKRPSEPPGEIPRGNGERIYFVDDEQPICTVTRKMLMSLGYEPTVFTSGAEALVAIQRNPAGLDLLVSDLTMPLMTGRELALRVLEQHPQIPVVLVSGYGENAKIESILKLGVSEFLFKPMDFRTLAATINRVLQRRNESLPKEH